jgi:hypothetical protein
MICPLCYNKLVKNDLHTNLMDRIIAHFRVDSYYIEMSFLQLFYYALKLIRVSMQQFCCWVSKRILVIFFRLHQFEMEEILRRILTLEFFYKSCFAAIFQTSWSENHVTNGIFTLGFWLSTTSCKRSKAQKLAQCKIFLKHIKYIFRVIFIRN